MLPIGNAFANGRLTSGLSSLLGRLKHSPTPIHWADPIASSIYCRPEWDLKPNEKEVTACLHHVLYIRYAAYSFRCCYPETSGTLSDQVSHRSGPSRVSEWLDWSHWRDLKTLCCSARQLISVLCFKPGRAAWFLYWQIRHVYGIARHVSHTDFF